MARNKGNHDKRDSKGNKKQFRKEPYRKGKDSKDLKEESSYDKNDDKKTWNDASWYIPNDKIREQVGTFAVNTVTGIPQFLESASGELPNADGRSEIQYGSVMSITLFPYPGTGTSLTSSINGVSALDTACRKLYTSISSVNSKTTQYTPESLGIAIIALGELVSLISFAQRLYGVAFTYNPRNRYVPSQIIQAMGMSDSILDDLALYRMQLNKLITAANNVRMLKDLKYFTKCWRIYNDYYEDSSSGLAQFYVMKPGGYLRYDETSPTTGELTWVPFTDGMTYTQLIQHIQTCLNSLLTSSLMNYVYTDIVNYVLKEGGELLGFDYVGELYAVLPSYDQTFLTQIHNMTWGMFDLTDYKVFENTESLEIETTDIFNMIGSGSDYAPYRMASSGSRIIDFPFSDNPSIDDKVDAVMYQTIVWDIDSDGKPMDIAAPDHPVYSVTILQNDAVNTVALNQFPYRPQSGVINYMNQWSILKSFDIAPILYEWSYSGANGLAYMVHASLNYFTVMQYKQLKNIYDFAFLGLFDAEVKNVKPI